jgi:hypothetical protein
MKETPQARFLSISLCLLPQLARPLRMGAQLGVYSMHIPLVIASRHFAHLLLHYLLLEVGNATRKCSVVIKRQMVKTV